MLNIVHARMVSVWQMIRWLVSKSIHVTRRRKEDVLTNVTRKEMVCFVHAKMDINCYKMVVNVNWVSHSVPVICDICITINSTNCFDDLYREILSPMPDLARAIL